MYTVYRMHNALNLDFETYLYTVGVDIGILCLFLFYFHVNTNLVKLNVTLFYMMDD